MAVKKSELFSTLWDSCNTLRSKGGMDATQYKDYVLIILFIKVITDKYYGKNNQIISVPEEANFNTMISLKGKLNIGEKFNEILARIAEENELQGIIDVVDFNDETKLGKGKDLIDTLTELVSIFQNSNLDFSNNRADDNDVLGDAYEYLMKKFATEAGKSKGQFYTPSEVSRVMAKLIGINTETKSPVYVYDMACGSGSLLIKAGDEAPSNVKTYLYGQEKDNNTSGLAIMNMFLHGNPTAIIKTENTLTHPQFLENGRLKTFDYCVANPPFSIKKWSDGMGNTYDRFSLGTPPENCADYAFLLHMLKSMDPEHGRGAIILPHGVLFRGNQEEIIRRNLIKGGYIEGIIGLPSNLFYGTGIPACIIILDKRNAGNRKSVFIIDASKGFTKDGNKNKLRECDIKKIVDTYINKIDIDRYSKNVSTESIEKEDYNLNIPRYVDSSTIEVEEDFVAHINGGIPEQNIEKYSKFWIIAPELKKDLFKANEKEHYLDLKVERENIDEVIENSTEIINYKTQLENKVNVWKNIVKEQLFNFSKDIRVKDLIDNVSEKIKDIFEDDVLIDKYDAYEYLMEYVNLVMKDDLYLIEENGWVPELVFDKDKKGNIKKNSFESDLLPKYIIINKYFNNEQSSLDKLNDSLNSLVSDFESTVDDNTGDEQLFTDEDKVNEQLIKSKIKESESNEIEILNSLLDNLSKQKNIKKAIKDLQLDLDEKVINKYSLLDEVTSKELLINDKWYTSIDERFHNEMNNLTSELSGSILKDYDKYAYTLSDIDKKIIDNEKELSTMIKELDGNRQDDNAFIEFIKDLIGDSNE